MKCIKGYFQRFAGLSSEYPFIDAEIYKEGKYVGRVSFLIDTGAGATLIARKDAIRLGLKPKRERGARLLVGFGGIEKISVVKNVKIRLLDVSSSNAFLEFEIEDVMVETFETMKKVRGESASYALMTPSVLGWDALKDLEIRINYKDRIVELCKLNY